MQAGGIKESTLGLLRDEFPVPDTPFSFRKFLMEDTPGSWAVACSGGADSVFLAMWLRAHFPVRDLCLLHFNHRTRACEEHAKDKETVEHLAESLSAQFLCTTAGTPEDRRDEASLRQARFSFFEQAMDQIGSRTLFLGHHRDDVVETLLMRLVRGSGLEGLAAPRRVHRHPEGRLRVRPLLNHSGSSIRGFLTEHRIAFREDSSNASRAYLRNRIRHQVLPHLREACPDRDVFEGFLRSHELLEEDADGWRSLLVSLVGGGGVVGTDALLLERAGMPVPRALLRRLIHHWCLHVLGWPEPPPSTMTDGMLDGMDRVRASGGEIRLAVEPPRGMGIGEWNFVLTPEKIALRKRGPDEVEAKPFSVLVAGCGEVFFRDGSSLRVDRGCRVDRGRAGPLEFRVMDGDLPGGFLLDSSFPPADAEVEAWMDADLLPAGPIIFRTWRPGDRFRPLGAPGTRKLQDWFTDRKWTLKKRHKTPVVTDADGGVLWVPGFPPADWARIGNGTKRVLRLTYTPSASS